MKCVNYKFLVLLVILCTSCEKSTEPPIEDLPPPGIQEDIPWPSLADSPWPIYRGDPQNTGRSKGIGPQVGFVEWSMEFSLSYPESKQYSSYSPALGFGKLFNPGYKTVLLSSIK